MGLLVRRGVTLPRGMMGDMDDTEKVYTLADAAAATGRSMPTIRRKRAELEAAGAIASPSGWQIPHSALIAAGFKPDWTTADVGGTEKPRGPHVGAVEAEPIPTPTEELRVTQDRVRRLESENVVLRGQVENAQAIARERLDALNDLRVAFRALAMSRPQPELQAVPDPAPQPAESHQADEPKRGWWSRMWT